MKGFFVHSDNEGTLSRICDPAGGGGLCGKETDISRIEDWGSSDIVAVVDIVNITRRTRSTISIPTVGIMYGRE